MQNHEFPYWMSDLSVKISECTFSEPTHTFYMIFATVTELKFKNISVTSIFREIIENLKKIEMLQNSEPIKLSKLQFSRLNFQ